MQYIDNKKKERNVFMKNNISIKEAAEKMGKSKEFVRIGLQRNLLPFGMAQKMSSRYTYYISPIKFYEYIGKLERSQQ